MNNIYEKSEKLMHLIQEIENIYSKKIVIQIDNDMDSLGGFDYQKESPTFVFRDDTLTESNIAHELIHALQLKKGFPIIIQNLTYDEKFLVIRELNSNLLHISLVKEMTDRGISVKEYIKVTIKKIKRFIKDSKKVNEMRNTIIERKHFDAIILLRIEYEAIYLNKVEKEQILKKYKTNYLEAYNLFIEINSIIEKKDMYTVEGVKEALKEVILLLNKECDYSLYLNLLEE